MIKVLVCGIAGHMGRNILDLLKGDQDACAVCGVDVRTPENFEGKVYKSFDEVSEKVDVVIDFSSPACLEGELDYCKKYGVPAVIAATGHTKEQLEYIKACAEDVAIFRTANFSVGVNLLVKLVREAAEFLGEKFDIEIIEKHHNLKKDAPSGTALMLAESANSAFDPENGPQRGLPQGDEGMFPQTSHAVSQAHGGRGLALTGWGGVDGSDKDQLAVWGLRLVQQPIIDLCLVAAVVFQILLRHAGDLGDLSDGFYRGALCNLNVCFHVPIPPLF